MKNKKFHWIDESIKIDFDVPESLQKMMESIEKMDLEEDYSYFNWIEVLDCDMKEYVNRGELTSKQRDLISDKYRG